MASVFYKPTDNTSILIDHYLSIKYANTKKIVQDKFVPDGCCAFVFNFGNPIKYISKDETLLLPHSILTLPFLGHLKMELKPPLDSFIVVLKASIMSKLFNLSLSNNRKRSFFTVDKLNGYPIWESLNSTKKFDERISVFTEFLQKKVIPKNYKYDLLDKIYLDIMDVGGVSSIGSILKQYKINPRSFRRKFIKRVGISAKSLSRIVRVNYFWKRIQNISAKELQNLIFECKYYDQSHFIKDFKSIIGETPQSFFRRDLSNVKMISGKR